MNHSLLTLFFMTLCCCFLANSHVIPDTVLEELKPGEWTHVIKRVDTPPFPRLVDIVILEDETGSFADDIDEIQGDKDAGCTGGLAEEIFDELHARTDSLRFGVAGFMDFYEGYEDEGWGNLGDVPFTLIQPLTFDKTEFLDGICELEAMGGADFPESQYYALQQTALNFDWREDLAVSRIVVLVTDAPAHDEDGYPGPTIDETIATLQGEGIHVIVLEAAGASGYERIADETGGVIRNILSDSSDIVDAILSAIVELTSNIYPVLSDCDPDLKVTFEPEFIEDASFESEHIFIESIKLKCRHKTKKHELLKCTVNFMLDDASIGEEKIYIVPTKKSCC